MLWILRSKNYCIISELQLVPSVLDNITETPFYQNRIKYDKAKSFYVNKIIITNYYVKCERVGGLA